jgi:cytoskeletal protein RodZ
MAYSGKALRTLREEKQIPLRGISDSTRINLTYLAAIEEERFDRFPGAFYFKSFTREYARALGLDPNEVLRDLEAAYLEWSKPLRPLAPPPPANKGLMARFRVWDSRRRTRDV